MKKEYYKMITFPMRDSKNGILSVFEYKKNGAADTLPFEPKRILTMHGMKNGDVRGGHTHYETVQILFCIQGSCKVDLDNGHETASITLNTRNEGLLLLPYVWHVMRDFTEDTILLVIASSEYDETDYIRNYDDFKRIVAEKKPW